MKTYSHIIPSLSHIKLDESTWLTNFAPVDHKTYMEAICKSETYEYIFLSRDAYSLDGNKTKDYSAHFIGGDIEILRKFWQAFDKLTYQHIGDDMVNFYVEGRMKTGTLKYEVYALDRTFLAGERVTIIKQYDSGGMDIMGEDGRKAYVAEFEIKIN